MGGKGRDGIRRDGGKGGDEERREGKGRER